MSEMNADLKAAQQRILALKHNLLELEEAGKRTAERLIQVERRLSDANGEVLRLGLQLKHHLQLQAERDALASKLAELEGQEPIGEVIHSDVLPNAEEKYRHEFVSDFRIGVQAELFVRPVPAEQPVNARLLDVATGKIPHLYAGLCPDIDASPRSRDPECPACQVISAAESAPKAAEMMERLAQQQAGTHPAPCARSCEANAYQIEVRRYQAEVEQFRADARRFRIAEKNLFDVQEAAKIIAKQAIAAEAERDALAAKLAELEGQEPVAWIYDWQAPEGLIRDWSTNNAAEIPEGATNIRPLFARQVPAEMSPEFTDTARSALLWVLWHHQGGSSPVGQPIRYALGMDAHEHLSAHQVQEAKRWAATAKADSSDFRRVPVEPVNARLLEALKWAADNPGDDAYWIEQARAAIASAESQAGPVRLTDDEIESYWTDNVEGWHLQFARAIESAVLRKNGIEVAE